MSKVDKKLFKKVDDLMQQLVGRESINHPAHVITELFNLHNETFNAREYSKSCSACRKRVYNRLRLWWIDNGGVKRIEKQ